MTSWPKTKDFHWIRFELTDKNKQESVLPVIILTDRKQSLNINAVGKLLHMTSDVSLHPLFCIIKKLNNKKLIQQHLDPDKEEP